MAEIIQNKLYFSVKKLVSNKIVSYNTIKKGCEKYRKGVYSTWAHKRFSYIDGTYIEHPVTSRKGNVYIEYASLRDNYKELIKAKLCNNTDPYLFVRNHKTTTRKQELETFKQSLSDYLEIDPTQITFFTELKQYTPSDCQRLARGAAWLRLLNSINAKEAHKKGYKSVLDLRSAALDIINQELNAGLVRFKGKKLGSNQVLFRYMTAYKNYGCKCLVTEKTGNNNAQKITPEISAWLIDEMSKAMKPSREDIAEAYNTAAEKNAWQKITTSAIKQHLNKPEIMRVWYYNRHGEQAGNMLQSFIQRRKASFADAVWDLDGTKLQLYYRDEKGNKMLSELYVYYVIDEYSTAILGYSLAFTETSELVTEALMMAIENHSNRPYQLRFDNGKANVARVVDSLMDNMSKIHFPCEPRKARSKIIEVLQGHFEQRVLRKFANFKGGSPQTKREDSKANPDLLKEIKKHLPTQQEVIEQLKQAIIEWNNRGEERNNYGIMQGEAKIQRYAHAHEKRVKLNYFEKISMFMIKVHNNQDSEGLYTYKNQGIQIQLFKKQYNYIVQDADGVGDFIFQQNNYGEKFTVRVNPKAPSFALLYKNGKFIEEAVLKEKYAGCVADMQKGEYSTIRTYQLKQKQYGDEYAKSELERQRAILKKAGMKATGTDGYGWQDSSKDDWNATESQQVDELNGVAEESELVKRLKTIGN